MFSQTQEGAQHPDEKAIPMHYVYKWYGELLYQFRLGVKPAYLIWSESANQVRCVGVDGSDYFSVDARQITESELTLSEIKLKINNKWHIFL